MKMPKPRGNSKIKISGSKPEPPPFLQRIREQLVADEDANRKEQSEKKRKSRPIRDENPEDEPELVRVGDDNFTEEEFEQMKKDLETQYRLDKRARITEDLDMDHLIKSRDNKRVLKAPSDAEPRDKLKSETALSSKIKTSSGKSGVEAKKTTKTLNYGSSSSDED